MTGPDTLFDEAPVVATDPPPAAAERGKFEAFLRFELHHERLLLRARRALLGVLLERGSATADDIRELVALPPGVSPKVFGAVAWPLAELRIVERGEYVKSTRPEAHGRPNRQWVLRDRAAAVAWLAQHPDGLNTDKQATTAPAGGVVANPNGSPARDRSPEQL
jgi:hypothetical protein